MTKELTDKIEALRILREEGLSEDEAAHVVSEANEPLYKASVVMSSFAVPREIILDALNISNQVFDAVLKVTKFKELHEQFCVKFLEYSGEDVYKNLMPLAAQAFKDILTKPNTNAATKLSAATQVKDTVNGKPRQAVDVNNFNLNVNSSAKELDKQISLVQARIRKLETSEVEVINTQDLIEAQTDDS